MEQFLEPEGVVYCMSLLIVVEIAEDVFAFLR